MTVSEYNLIRFIEDISYNDHQSLENQNWDVWFKGVSRLYNHKIPCKLLKALQRKGNPVITEMCDVLLSKMLDAQEKQRLENEQKHEAWIKRLNALPKKPVPQPVPKVETCVSDIYYEERKSLWEQKVKEYIEIRNKSLF